MVDGQRNYCIGCRKALGELDIQTSVGKMICESFTEQSKIRQNAEWIITAQDKDIWKKRFH